MKAQFQREPRQMKIKIRQKNESTDDINFCSNEPSGRAYKVFSTTLSVF